MLYNGQFGKTLVSEEFNTQCVIHSVEAAVKPSPNPGDPYHALRQISFRSFNSKLVKVIQQNKKKTEHLIPAKGTLDIVLAPGESLPILEKGPE